MDSYGSSTTGAGGGWHADPTGRHQHRFWNGGAWTDDVADNGVPGKDPLVAPAPQWGAAQAPGVAAQPPQAAPGYGGQYAPANPCATGAPYGAYLAAATVGGKRSAGRIVSAIIGLVGGALVVGGTFLDWLSAGPLAFTGWDIYDVQSKGSENIFVLKEMFDGWSPFFTGLTTLICGVVLIVVALLVLVLRGSRTPGSKEINVGLSVFLSLIATLAVLPCLWNAFEWVTNGRDFGVVDSAVGLWLVLAGAIVALLGITSGLARRRPRAQSAPLLDEASRS